MSATASPPRDPARGKPRRAVGRSSFVFAAGWREVAVSLVLALASVNAAQANARSDAPVARSIASLERVRLGGVEQAIFLRGDDVRNPILLFLHGGPGVPEMPIWRANCELEKDFTVVHWDQRGAGKSYDAALPDAEMTLAHFVSDSDELVRALLRRFGQRKLFLVGHSWGSLVGLIEVAKAPQLFHSYIGLGQFVNIGASERSLDRVGRERARALGNRKALRVMEEIGPPPYQNHRDERTINKVTKDLVKRDAPPFSAARFAGLAFNSGVYSLADDFNILRGALFSGRKLEREIYAADLRRSVRQVKVPVYFLEGRYDTVLSPEVAAEYLRSLSAPAGRHFVWFNRSEHWPHLEERAKFHAEMRAILKATRSPAPP